MYPRMSQCLIVRPSPLNRFVSYYFFVYYYKISEITVQRRCSIWARTGVTYIGPIIGQQQLLMAREVHNSRKPFCELFHYFQTDLNLSVGQDHRDRS